ncbi:MarR family winged helix-turn-helix transcriptional regulator [Janibacter sp. GXQ6167]|uniref:MarR family winged helix-turn-helix transcriptional regulator n=1 Tax=Janibacter sp. GXQ6167 TaxID=3240791 RepID=UPI0035236CE4
MTTAARIGAWRTYIEASIRLQTELDERLRREAGLSLSDFNVLLTLSEAPNRRLRLGELAQAMIYSASRLTYQSKVLAGRGWVERQDVPEDGRGQYLRLTDAGADALDRARVTHGRDVDELFQSHVNDDEVDVIGRVFARLQN